MPAEKASGAIYKKSSFTLREAIGDLGSCNIPSRKKLFLFFKKTVAFFGKCGRIIYGGIAQLGEHMHHTHGVAGSSPVVSIISAVGRQRFLLQSLKKLNGWGHSLAGKALRSQRRDRGFESRCLHKKRP